MASWRAFLLIMSLLATEPALADMKDAWDAYDHGEYDKAAELFRAEADHGDSEAQYMMGQLYGEGHLGPRDFASAARWYEKAAQQGHPDAENALGYQYDFGLGLPRDRGLAAMWYERAAAQGNVAGRNNIAYEWAQAGRRFDDALAYARGVVAVAPKVGAYQDTLGWILYKMQRYAESIPPLCRAAKLDPGSPEIHSHLGDAFWHVGLNANARMQWQQAYDLAERRQLLSEQGEDFLYAEGDGFKAAMQARLAKGLGDGPAPAGSSADPAAVDQALGGDCNIPTS
ncbi:MAG: hypothetical protein QOK29_3212 [Rhodospirillaceae bacterium]|jgi:TPR repeat protein|nr:hypothetical protein [Rhodospirillaceae bacterium]